MWYPPGVPIVGDRPESGVRIALERDREAGPPWRYRGAAFLPTRRFPASVDVSGAGDVHVELAADPETGEAPPPGLSEKLRLIVRTVHRQASADGEAPAWRIVRWRGEK